MSLVCLDLIVQIIITVIIIENDKDRFPKLILMDFERGKLVQLYCC